MRTWWFVIVRNCLSTWFVLENHTYWHKIGCHLYLVVIEQQEQHWTIIHNPLKTLGTTMQRRSGGFKGGGPSIWRSRCWEVSMISKNVRQSLRRLYVWSPGWGDIIECGRFPFKKFLLQSCKWIIKCAEFSLFTVASILLETIECMQQSKKDFYTKPKLELHSER